MLAICHVYTYFLDGLLLLLILRTLILFQFMRLYLWPRQRVPAHARFLTVFQAACAIAHAVCHTDPSQKRLLFDFVGQDHVASKGHLLCIDAVIAGLHMLLMYIAAEEASSFQDAQHSNALDLTDTERATQSPGEEPTALPPTTMPVAVVR